MRSRFTVGVAIIAILALGAPARADSQSKSYSAGAGDAVCFAALDGVGCVHFIATGTTVRIAIADEASPMVGGTVCTPDCSTRSTPFCASTTLTDLRVGDPVLVFVDEGFGIMDCAMGVGAGVAGTVTATFS